MKVKFISLALVLALAGIFSGCGKSQPAVTEPPKQAEVTETTEQTQATEATEQTQATEAMTPAQEALQCYQEILTSAPAIEGQPEQLQDASFDDVQNREMFGKHYDEFAIVDLNGDGIPELIASTVINFRWVPVSVFTYDGGQAVLLTNPLEGSVNGTFEQNSSANGAYVTYLCGQNHIHSLWSGDTPVGQMEENHAYTLEGTTLTTVDCEATEGTSLSDIAKPNTAENASALIAG